MQLNSLKREHPNKKARTVGRGGVHGKTSGRGTKGQKSRAGNKRRPELRDIIKKLPKLRGYRFNSHSKKIQCVNLSSLNVFTAGATVDSNSLFEKGLVRKIGGSLPEVKILGNGDLNVKIEIVGCSVSENAKAKIEKAGGIIK